ncbi:hypothetical protein SLEP1_g57877 [Rubroshorea leprosula]|uniref:Uncharacterized protein n=1 Tax=Rubroshorea leprosula TaxID=152421 RepID=A0AAV5MP62_9ROSI|nr:hypothetical protein SLEP1_g57877 [Rubroshorea leprosula]
MEVLSWRDPMRQEMSKRTKMEIRGQRSRSPSPFISSRSGVPHRSACTIIALTCRKAATVGRKVESNSWHFGIDG